MDWLYSFFLAPRRYRKWPGASERGCENSEKPQMISSELNQSAPDIKSGLDDIGKNIKDSSEELMDDFKKFKDDLD